MARKAPDAPLTLSEQWAIDRDDPITLNRIMHRLADGDSLKEICASAGWPKSFVWKWITDDGERRQAYDDALKCWADEMAQETVRIADDANPEEVNKAKLRVDTRLKVASKWDRQRYGEQPAVNITAQSGSLISILSALPALTAPEEDDQPEAIDVTPTRVQPEKVIPLELREADEAAKKKKDDDDFI